MKTKFVSLIVSVAVILGLLLVPAALPALPGGVVLASSNVTISVQPPMTKVSCAQAFNLTVEIDNPDGVQISTVAARLDFGTTCFNVTGITNGPAWDTYLLNQYDNANGTIDYDAGILGGAGYTNSTTIIACTINCLATCATGTSSVDFVWTDGPPPRKTAVEYGPTDYLEGGNMSLMYGATVKCGSPALTVDIVPDGKGTVEANGDLLIGDPNTTNWDWDEVVKLEAIESTAGWVFDDWTGTDNNAVNPTNVTMTDAKNVTANFVELPCDLDVDPNHLDLTARWGGYEDSDTVTIANDGGHTLCWALGETPTWGVGDWWNYANIYQPFSPVWQSLVPGSNFSYVNISVTGGGSGSDYQCAVNIAPPLQRAMMGGMPCVLYSGVVTYDECTLDMVEQIGIMGIYPKAGVGNFTEVTVQANLTWAFDGCHGWPYYLGKSWNYNLTMDVNTLPNWTPVDYKVIPAMAVVTDWNVTLSAWEITHIETTNMTAFMQTWWSPTVKNFVAQADGGTYDFPPMDIRSLAGFSTAAPPAGPPSWLSFDKAGGSLGIAGSELLTVTANTSGLNVTTYNGNFTISGCCGSVQTEIVTVSFLVTPATTLEDVFRDLPADRLLPDAEYPGMTFDVYVNFSAPVADFNSIGVTDFAPAGWLVETNDDWCTPKASWNKSNYNKAEYSWAGPYDPPQNFTAKYKVTIPATATAGSNFWPNCTSNPCPPCEGSPINLFPAWVEYWFGAQGPFETIICEEREKVVTVPGCVVGETRDVNAKLLDTVTVALFEQPMDWEDSDSSSLVPVSSIPVGEHVSVEGGTFSGNFTTWYENCADDTGYYWQYASKYCYYPINTSDMPSPRNFSHLDYINWSAPEQLAAGYRMDFEADYGLVCKAASMSYAMTSVNHWLFVPIDEFDVPHPEWQIHSWKADESIHSWQFPCGCNC